MSKYCLDTFALMSFLQGEPGAKKVVDILESARGGKAKVYTHAVSLIEIYYTTLRTEDKIKAYEVLVRVKSLPMEISYFSEEDIISIGELKAKYKISLADAFCISLAIKNEAKIVTGDPEFKEVEKFVPIEWLPRK